MSNNSEMLNYGPELGLINHPFVLYFTAKWCAPCKRYGPLLDRLSDQVADVRFVKVDADQYPGFLERWKVRSVPTLLYVKDRWGDVAEDSLVGVKTETEVLEFLANNA